MDKPEEQETKSGKLPPKLSWDYFSLRDSGVEREKLIWGLPRAVASIVVLVIVAAVAYRVVIADIDLKFDFPSFLSLLLALFAVGLSALFYFKTTDTSNQFYDNTHKFTNEVSQILGRIEAGFGERLKHLDEGQAGMMDRFDKMPFNVTEAREQVVEDEKKVAEYEARYQEAFNDLAERAKMNADEAKELFSTLNRTQAELDMSKEELRQLQNRIRDEEESLESGADRLDYLWGKVKDRFAVAYGARLNVRSSSENISDYIVEDVEIDLVNRMIYFDFFNGVTGHLTDSGVRFCRDILRDVYRERRKRPPN